MRRRGQQTQFTSVEAGFSLLEVLIAVGLLTCALAALAPLVAAAVRSDFESRARTVAVVAAQQKQEELLSLVTGDPLPPQGADLIDLAGRTTSAEAGDAVFRRRWQIQPLAADPGGAVVIRVEVTSPARVLRTAVTLATVRRRGVP